MRPLFQIDGPICRFLTRVFDIAYLNILCLLCCVPIITIGPSFTALYYCTFKIQRDEDSSITKMFFRSFTRNLKHGIIMTILYFGIGAFLLMDIQINRALDGGAQRYIEMILHIGVAILVATVSYSFPLLAQFDNTIMLTVKNSFFMAILNIRYSIPIAALNAIPVMLLVYLPELFLWSAPMWALFGFALIAVINTRLLNKVFEKYILAEKEIQEEANNM